MGLARGHRVADIKGKEKGESQIQTEKKKKKYD